MRACPRLHYRLLTLCPAPTDPVGQSWRRGGTGHADETLPVHVHAHLTLPACLS
jgi:hypothetical protein